MEFVVKGKDNFRFEIPDEWLSQAGFDSFCLNSDYYEIPTKFDSKRVLLLDHSCIYPRKRNNGVLEYRKESMINFLCRIRCNQPIDPIIIMKPSTDNGFEYWLKDGYHRYRASFAAGFKKIPAILEFNPDIE